MVEMETFQVRFSDLYHGFARWWCPSSPCGAVLYLHGIQSHGGWFDASAQRLAEAGFAVLLPDRRGSGRNERERGHLTSTRRLLTDVTEWIEEIHVRTGFEKVHLLGVSWGGKLALAYHRYAPARAASLSLIAPGIFAQVDLPTHAKVRVAWSLMTSPRNRFDIPLNDPALFTGNGERQTYIAKDPLSLRQVSASFLGVSRKLDAMAHAVGPQTPPCPLRLFLAGRDRIISNERTRQLVRHLNWPERDIIEYPDAHHTLEFEPDPTAYFNDLTEWLQSRATPAVPASEQVT